MNSISINNEKYVKATDIARELGYTADYVGQLCRGNKVVAQLVGRSWYVSEDSIREHKRNRYRSTKTVNKKTIVKSLKTRDMDEKDSIAVSIKKNEGQTTSRYATESFYSRTPVHAAPRYSTDESELIPLNSSIKTGKISVTLGDAQSVKIKSTSKEYDFDPTIREKVRFEGNLQVQDVYEEDSSIDSPEPEPVKNTSNLSKEISDIAKTEKSTEIKSSEDARAKKIQVTHLRKDKKSSNKDLPIENNDTGIIGMKRRRIIDRNPLGGTLKVDVPEEKGIDSSSGVYFIVASMILSVAMSSLILGLQADIQIQDSSIITSYTFEIEELKASVYYSVQF